jgi:hypothetical protein
MKGLRPCLHVPSNITAFVASDVKKRLSIGDLNDTPGSQWRHDLGDMCVVAAKPPHGLSEAWRPARLSRIGSRPMKRVLEIDDAAAASILSAHPLISTVC